MVWTIEWNEKALKEFKKLDRLIQIKLLKFLNTRIAKNTNPRVFGKALSHDKQGLWRYRVENFRMVCKIKGEVLTILVVQVGHRKNVYEK